MVWGIGTKGKIIRKKNIRHPSVGMRFSKELLFFTLAMCVCVHVTHDVGGFQSCICYANEHDGGQAGSLDLWDGIQQLK